MFKKNFAAYASMAVTSVVFGFSFLFTKRALAHLEIFQLLGIRFLLAAAVMSILVITGIVKVSYNRKKLLTVLAVALFEPVIYFIGETIGIKLTTASESGMMIALIPVVVTVFSTLILKEKVTLKHWIAILVAVAGVTLIIAAKGLALGGAYFLGYLMLGMAVLSAGLYNTLSRRASAVCTPFEITFVMIWISTIVFNAIGLFFAGSEGRISRYFTDALPFDVLSGILYLGLISSIIAFFCLNYGLSKIKASVSAVFSNLTTVVSILAGVAFNGEKLYGLQLAGAALVLLGIWGVTKAANSDGVKDINTIVESERLYLRPFVQGDYNALLNIWGDETVMRFCDGAVAPQSINNFIKTDIKNFKKYGNSVFAVIEKKTENLVGITGCRMEPEKQRQGELVTHFAREAWGKGYASEINKAYIDWLKKNKILDCVYGSVMPDNISSINMAQKLGFKQNGFVQYEDTGFIDEPFFEMYL